MGKNSFKQYDQQGINLQSIQTLHTAQYKKKNDKPIKKWADISLKKTYKWPEGK